MPFIDVVRVKEYKFRTSKEELDDRHGNAVGDLVRPEGRERLRSANTRGSVWNCDGEVIHEPQIHIK